MASFRLRIDLTNRRSPDHELAQTWNAFQELTRTQWLVPAEIEQLQLARVRTLLAHCVVAVPHYRQALAAAHMRPEDVHTMADFRRIPLLSRRICQEQQAELCAAHLPFGTMTAGQAFTSGSSGMPLKVLKTNIVDRWWLASCLRFIEWNDVDPRGTLASIRYWDATGEKKQQLADGVRSAHWLSPLGRLIDMGPAYSMEMRQDPRKLLRWLEQVQPDYLVSYPATLHMLAGLVQEEGVRLPRLRSIESMASTLSEPTQKWIEAGFGVPVKNRYGCSEAGILATSCPEDHGLHVHAENALVEVLDAANEPCGPGETGRVFVTALHNFRAPFVRLELGDEATLGPVPCPCGRGLPLLSRIGGREDVLFRLPDGRRKSWISLAAEITGVGGHHQNQIIQVALDHVVLNLVVSKAWTDEHAGRLREKVHAFFEAPIRVDVEIRERLDPPPGGKLRRAICQVP